MLNFSEHHSFRDFLNHAYSRACSRLFLESGDETTKTSDLRIGRANRKFPVWLTIMCICILLCGNIQAQEKRVSTQKEKELLTIVIGPFEKSAKNHQYFFPKLLELVLSKTEATDGPFEITYHPYIYTSARIIAELKYGRSYNVIWTTPTEDRERDLLPIKISLLKGLNSYRIFLIRQEDQDKFKHINSVEDLRQFKAGSVSNWPDTKVMLNNDLPVVTSAHYELLFTMLAGRRFDYFPRGLYEVWDEQKNNVDKGIVVEDHIMIYYPAPIYFFVNRKDVKLADRIERGLRIAMQDGSYDELFFSIPGFKRGYEEIGNKSRRSFTLEDAPKVTPTPAKP